MNVPAFVRERLKSLFSLALRHVPTVGWMLVERLWMVISAIVVGFWIIRALGPADYGRFSAALTVAAVLAALSVMGMETVVVRRLASGQHEPSAVLSTAVIYRLAGSVVYVPLCWGAAKVVFPSYADVAAMAAIIASATVFRAADVVGFWQQVEGRYGQAARNRILARLVGDLLRIWLVLNGAGLVWFAVATLVEGIASAVVFLVSGRGVLRFRTVPDSSLARRMFADGWPLMGSAILAALYARIDQIVLFKIMGSVENGYYAAAVRISEAFNVVILSISTVAAAHFGRLTDASDSEFLKELHSYHRSMLFGSALIATALCTFADPLVKVMYGTSFLESATILRIHAWTLVLVCASVALEPWFFHFEKLRAYLAKTVITLLFSIPATIAGTRWFGAQGTALAVVATYFVSVFLTNAILPSLRGAFRFQIRSIFLPWSAK